MNSTFTLLAGVVFASACTTTSTTIVCSLNKPQTVSPMQVKDFTNQIIVPSNTYTAIFPNSCFSVYPPKKNYSEAFKRMRQSKTLNAIYKDASIGDVISVE